jgi:2-polyprenyl-3-methyl-5-hydroxy-6-metoxy-1,4-benzoquinol methylase
MNCLALINFSCRKRKLLKNLMYFPILPWNEFPQDAVVFDMGCGSGRCARFVAPKVGRLNCFDPSSALHMAQITLAQHSNVVFYKGSVEESGLQLGSQEFGGSLGVLHHVPDTATGIRSCSALLKPRRCYFSCITRSIFGSCVSEQCGVYRSGGVV